MYLSRQTWKLVFLKKWKTSLNVPVLFMHSHLIKYNWKALEKRGLSVCLVVSWVGLRPGEPGLDS